LQRATDDITLILMTPHSPLIESRGSIVLQDENHNMVIIQYNGELFAVSTDKISLEDEVMRDVWGDQLYRIKFRTITAVDQAECIIKISNLTHARGG
jgi:hypothetical protein